MAACAALLLAAGTGQAHRLDEYLQATIISVEKDRIEAQLRLIPGVAVFPLVLASIDTDTDGVISDAEERAYAERVRRDLSLTINGERLALRLVSSTFGKTEALKEGLGEIELRLVADVPRSGASRTLIFENHHERRIAAYLVNCLAPRDPDIRVTTQDRNYQQSVYQVQYVLAGTHSGRRSMDEGADPWGRAGKIAILLIAALALLWRHMQARLSQAPTKGRDDYPEKVAENSLPLTER